MNILYVLCDARTPGPIPDQLCAKGYKTEVVDEPGSAIFTIRENPDAIDAVIFNSGGDVQEGLEFLTLVKTDTAIWDTPVIVQANGASEEEQTSLVEAGAYFCIVADIDNDILHSIVRTSAVDARQTRLIRKDVRNRSSGVGRLVNATFEIQTLDEARKLATMLSLPCPDPQSAAIGLTELLVNAIEHGNLGITYEQKQILLDTNSWPQEIEKRLLLTENRNKYVTVEFETHSSSIQFRIKDMGRGFDPKPFMTICPERMTRRNGRGIAMAAQFCFDKVEYIGCGNEVSVTIDHVAKWGQRLSA